MAMVYTSSVEGDVITRSYLMEPGLIQSTTSITGMLVCMDESLNDEIRESF